MLTVLSLRNAELGPEILHIQPVEREEHRGLPHGSRVDQG